MREYKTLCLSGSWKKNKMSVGQLHDVLPEWTIRLGFCKRRRKNISLSNEEKEIEILASYHAALLVYSIEPSFVAG